MEGLLRILQEQVRRRGLQGAPVVVGVSGGPDSVALWLLLCALPAAERPRLHLCHVDHGWRPGAALREQEICLALAQAAGAGLSVVHLPPPRRRSEEEARTLRLGVLARVARSLGAPAVALGHQRDDQVETVLLQLVRGTARATGMADFRAPFWRPLLGVPRSALVQVLAAAGQSYSVDATNESAEFARGRLRRTVLPLLRRENPRVTEAIARYAALRRADDAYLEAQARALCAGLAALPSGVDLRPLREAPDPLARRALRLLLAARGHPLEAARLEEALQSLRAGRRQAIGRELWLEGGALWWRVPRPEAQALRDGVRVRFGELWVGIGAPPGDALCAAIGTGAAAVRARRPGDRLRLQGGTRKLQDVLVDAKVARPLRDLLPVVTLEGLPVWLPPLPGAPGEDGRTVWVAPAAVVGALWSVLK